MLYMKRENNISRMRVEEEGGNDKDKNNKNKMLNL